MVKEGINKFGVEEGGKYRARNKFRTPNIGTDDTLLGCQPINLLVPAHCEVYEQKNIERG